MSSNFTLQSFLHKIEEGNWTQAIKLLALAFLGLGVLIVVVFDPMHWSFFRGLSNAKGMEQAQIAREIAAGNGYSTKMIRPLSIVQIREHAGDDREELKQRLSKDTYHAPLWSATLAPIFKALQGFWEFDPKQPIYLLDKVVAVFSILLLYAAVVVNFFTIRKLFDAKLAMIASGVQLVTYTFWQYAMSGLPHMLLLLLFSVTMLGLVNAIEAKDAKKSELKWIVLIAVMSGLMVLTHYLMAWVVIGLLIFIMFHFPSRWRNGLIITAVVLAMVAPWLVRNYSLTGHPFGIAWISSMHQVTGAEDVVMRRMDDRAMRFPYSHFRAKIQSEITEQLSSGISGWLAPLFFVTLLYPFRRTGVRSLRWSLLLMWLFAVVGMSIFSGQDVASNVSSTDLNFLFLPIFGAYGVALILTLWGGLKIRQKFLRNALVTLILVLSGLPLMNALLSKTHPLWWPPYAPPYMSFLGKWTKENEVIVSDMPWAVAWYADRTSLWMPNTSKEFVDLYDYDRIGRPFAGLFLSPVTEGAAFMTDIALGKYKGWAPLILRRSTQGFPFSKALPLGPHGMCIFYSDYERWSREEAKDLQEMQDEAEAKDKDAEETGKSEETKEENP